MLHLQRRVQWAFRIAVLAILCGVVAVVVGTTMAGQARHRPVVLTTQEKSTMNFPTIFVPGWHSTGYSTQLITDDIVSLGVTDTVTTVKVSPQGQFEFIGPKPRANSRNLLRIIFVNNRAGEVQYAQWLHQLMNYCYEHFGFRRVNLVGHSMGAYASTLYTFRFGQASGLPRVANLVTIAGPFDGIIGRAPLNSFIHPNDGTTWTDEPHQNRLDQNGRPVLIHPEYARLAQYASGVPKTLRMLNIYGDLGDGSEADGVVTIPSATSIAYLVKNRITVFKQVKVVGPNAQHSALHEHNWEVTQNVVRFLWPVFVAHTTS